MFIAMKERRICSKGLIWRVCRKGRILIIWNSWCRSTWYWWCIPEKKHIDYRENNSIYL